MREYVKFKDRDYEYGFFIYSHYTTILGLNSGEGKTWMFDTLAERYNEGIVKIEANYPVIFANTVNLLSLLKTDEKSIIFADEISINKNSQYLKEINFSKHFIVAITRAMPFRANSPLCGIYQVIARQDGHFQIEEINRHNDLRLIQKIDDIDIVVTEAAENCSEHNYIIKCRETYNLDFQVIAAGGKDRIANVLHNCLKTYPKKKILILMDLANVSSQYKLLVKRCKDNPDIFFYPYSSFEELLYKSKLVSSLNKTYKASPYDFCTLERYYENALEKVTSNSCIEYNHRHPFISECYVNNCNSCNKRCELFCNDKIDYVLDSSVGKILYKWIKDNLS